MNPDVTIALVAAFSSLDKISNYLDLLGIGFPTDKEVTLHLRGNMSTDNYNAETHYIQFSWEELIYPISDIGQLALDRWKVAQQETYEAEMKQKREKEKQEAQNRKRKRAANKGARTKRELATLARLRAKYESNPQQ